MATIFTLLARFTHFVNDPQLFVVPSWLAGGVLSQCLVACTLQSFSSTVPSFLRSKEASIWHICVAMKACVVFLSLCSLILFSQIYCTLTGALLPEQALVWCASLNLLLTPYCHLHSSAVQQNSCLLSWPAVSRKQVGVSNWCSWKQVSHMMCCSDSNQSFPREEKPLWKLVAWHASVLRRAQLREVTESVYWDGCKFMNFSIPNFSKIFCKKFIRHCFTPLIRI